MEESQEVKSLRALVTELKEAMFDMKRHRIEERDLPLVYSALHDIRFRRYSSNEDDCDSVEAEEERRPQKRPRK